MSPPSTQRRSISTFIQQLPPTAATSPPSDSKLRKMGRGRTAEGLAASLKVLGREIVCFGEVFV